MEGLNRNKKYTVIQPKDYEKYQIPISLGNYLPKAKNKYIWAELEKRHPCFSDNYVFFCKEKISPKGLISDVFVIDKNTLGKYKSSNNKIIIDKYRISLLKHWKKNYLYILIVFIPFIIFIVFFFKNKYTSSLVKLDVVQEKNETELKESEYCDYDKKYLYRLLNTVELNKGKIRNLSWKLIATGEYITGTVDNLYPEILEKEIYEASIKSTKYIDKKPFFDFSLKNEFVLVSGLEDTKQLSIKSREYLRSLLKEENISIISEDMNPYKINIEIPFDLIEEKNKNNIGLLERINNKLREEKIYVIGINIKDISQKESNKSLYIELILSEHNIYDNNILKDISEKLKLFYEETKIKKIFTRSEAKKKLVENKPDKFIGEIKYRNDKKVLFYKTPDGNIVKKEVLLDENS